MKKIIQEMENDFGKIKNVIVIDPDRDTAEFRVVSGTVRPVQDTSSLVIPESFSNAQVVLVAADEAAAKAKGTNTIYGAKGLIATGRDFASGVNLLYFYVNASNALGMAGTSADLDPDGIRIGVSATRFFRAGLPYHYTVYYWNDEEEQEAEL